MDLFVGLLCVLIKNEMIYRFCSTKIVPIILDIDYLNYILNNFMCYNQRLYESGQLMSTNGQY